MEIIDQSISFFEGYIDRVRVENSSFFIEGWILDSRSASPPESLDVFWKGYKVASIQEFFFREDLLNHGKGDGNVAFFVRIPRPGFTDDVSDISIGTPESPNTLRVTEEAEVIYAAGYCNFDRIDQDSVQAIGWACDPSSPESRLEVALYDGDRILGSCIANEFQEHLIDANIGDGCYGCKINLPADIFDGQEHGLSLIATLNSGRQVQSSIIDFTGNPFDIPLYRIQDFALESIFDNTIFKALRVWVDGDPVAASKLLSQEAKDDFSIGHLKVIYLGYELLLAKEHQAFVGLFSSISIGMIEQVSFADTRASIAFLAVASRCYLPADDNFQSQAYLAFFHKKSFHSVALQCAYILYTDLSQRSTGNDQALLVLAYAVGIHYQSLDLSENFISLALMSGDEWKTEPTLVRAVLSIKTKAQKFWDVIQICNQIDDKLCIDEIGSYFVVSCLHLAQKTPHVLLQSDIREKLRRILVNAFLYDPHKTTPKGTELLTLIGNSMQKAVSHSKDGIHIGSQKTTISYRNSSIGFLNALTTDFYFKHNPTTIEYQRPIFRHLLLVSNSDLPQCYYYRIKQKMEQIDIGNAWSYSELDINELCGLKWQKKLVYIDVIILARLPISMLVSRLVAYAKSLNIIVLYDIDDLIFNEAYFPGSISEYAGSISNDLYLQLGVDTGLFKLIMQQVSGFIASTPALADRIQEILASTPQLPLWVHRNAIGNDLLYLSERVTVARHNEEAQFYAQNITIFYGSATKAHKKVFYDVLAPALAHVLKHYPAVLVKLIGFFYLPPSLREHDDRIYILEPMGSYLDYLTELSKADINVAILEETPFTDCKSEIKWLEAAVFKIPSIVTPTSTYRQILEDGKTALFARTVEDWISAISGLLEDRQKLKHIGENAYTYAVNNYSPQVGANNLSALLDDATNDFPQTKSLPRILFVNVFYAPQSIGGATRVVENQVKYIKELLDDKAELYVLCADAHPDPRAPYEVEQYVWDGVLITRLFVPLKDWEEYQDHEVFKFAIKFFHAYDFDLVHIHCLQCLTASIVEAAQKWHIPYIVTVHDAWWLSRHLFLINTQDQLVNIHTLEGEIDDDDEKPLSLTDDYNEKLNAIKFRKQYLFNALKRAEKVLAVSQSFASLYESVGLTNVLVNENGIEPFERLLRTQSKTGKVRVAHIGGNIFHKGYNLFQSALEKYPYKNIEAVVIDNHLEPGGAGGYEQQWGTVKVRFLPKFRQSEINQLYSQIDVLVAPSIWPESYGLVTREAKYAGVWVIASDRGAIGADVVEGIDGNIVSVEDEYELASRFLEIDENPKQYLLQQPEVAVRDTSQQAEELMHIYNSLIEL